MNTKKTLTATKKDLDTAAERAGELCVAGIPKNFKIWIEELREKHPGYTYNEVYNAYRLANPRNNRFAKSRQAHVDIGHAKNTGEFHLVTNRLAIERENDIAEARQVVLEKMKTKDISTINPGFLKIFGEKHELSKTGNKSKSDEGDGGNKKDPLGDLVDLVKEDDEADE